MIQKSTFFYLYSTLENCLELANDHHFDSNQVVKKTEFEPSEGIIKNILSFSDSYYPINTKYGSVELMIN